jgi:hypothetical protein
MEHINANMWSNLENQYFPNIPPSDCPAVTDKRERHNIVERNRRDKTRAFIERLQSMLPNISEKRQNPNINFVLERALEYLQDGNQTPLLSSDDDIEDSDPDRESTMNKVRLYLAAGMPARIDDISCRRHMFTFENAPFGIVIARTDGVLMKANDYFRSMFIVPQGPLIGYTMFKLTSSRDLPITMQVCVCVQTVRMPLVSIRPCGQGCTQMVVWGV